MKSLKFRDHLVKMVLSGEKDVTWRLFDEKDLQNDDTAELINWNTGEIFGKAILTDVREKKLGDIQDADFDGHETFASQDEMFATYRTYYGDRVGPDTIVKIIRFQLQP